MSKSVATIRHDVEDALEDVVKSLQTTAMSLSGEASDAVSKAAADVARAAEAVRKHTLDGAKDVARKAAHEIQEHPVAALAAAITAAAALVGVIVAARHLKD